jgi:hypothetical protein
LFQTSHTKMNFNSMNSLQGEHWTQNQLIVIFFWLIQVQKSQISCYLCIPMVNWRLIQ